MRPPHPHNLVVREVNDADCASVGAESEVSLVFANAELSGGMGL